MKSDDKALQTVKLTFPTNTKCNKASFNGDLVTICTINQSDPYSKENEFSADLDALYVRFLDISVPIANCHSNVTWQHCSQEHSLENYTGNHQVNCANCSEDWKRIHSTAQRITIQEKWFMWRVALKHRLRKILFAKKIVDLS